jgi:hypothetical protein
MDSKIWGPGAWTFLHSITMTYPERPGELEKQFYKNFFKNLGNVLPCPKCKEHYNQHLKDLPLDDHLSSRREIVEWLISLHNKVNLSLGKTTLDYDQVMQIYYKKYYEQDHVDTWLKKHEEWFTKEKVILYIILIILIIIALVKYHRHIINYFKRQFKSTQKASYY